MLDTKGQPASEGIGGSWAARGGAALAMFCILLTVAIQLSPQLQTLLEFNRAAVSAGQVWRLVTCHLVHWGWHHLAGDISALVGLLWLLRKQAPPAITALLTGGLAVLLGWTVCVLAPDINIYRGMSGINHALLGWLLLSKVISTSKMPRFYWCITLVLFIAKGFCELFQVPILPGVGLPDHVTIVAEVHLAGLAGGMVFASITTREARNQPCSRQSNTGSSGCVSRD